jgi:hypothetical protein
MSSGLNRPVICSEKATPKVSQNDQLRRIHGSSDSGRAERIIYSIHRSDVLSLLSRTASAA